MTKSLTAARTSLHRRAAPEGLQCRTLRARGGDYTFLFDGRGGARMGSGGWKHGADSGIRTKQAQAPAFAAIKSCQRGAFGLVCPGVFWVDRRRSGLARHPVH
jgi:hypothetical protein